ncbi:MAG: RNA polymerase sigma-70 factor, partial [Bacteroidota bacterium]
MNYKKMVQTQLANQKQKVKETNEELFVLIKHENSYSAFEELYHRMYKPLTLYAFRYTKSPELADDMVSEVFFKLWKKRETININSAVQSYLYTSVRNRCLDRIRSEHGIDHCNDEILINFDSFSPTPLQYTISEELQKRIETAIEALPKDRRRVFRMSRDNGLKYKEIAETLGISVKTVETQMGRALKF